MHIALIALATGLMTYLGGLEKGSEQEIAMAPSLT
jgi:hypothetical protein